MRKLLFRLANILPCRIISDGDHSYLERYFVFQAFGLDCYLHRFVASDPDRGLHDHPNRFAFSIILSGFYTEITRYGSRDIRWMNFLTGDSFHRVILPARFVPITIDGLKYRTEDGEQECWTLFFRTSKRAKEWGFLRDKKQLGIVFTPHRYSPREREDWWTDAPVGRYCRGRMPEAA